MDIDPFDYDDESAVGAARCVGYLVLMAAMCVVSAFCMVVKSAWLAINGEWS